MVCAFIEVLYFQVDVAVSANGTREFYEVVIRNRVRAVGAYLYRVLVLFTLFCFGGLFVKDCKGFGRLGRIIGVVRMSNWANLRFLPCMLGAS